MKYVIRLIIRLINLYSLRNNLEVLKDRIMARHFGKETSNTYGHYLKFSYDIKVFFVRQKTFLISWTYIYMQQEPLFCKRVFAFCATRNMFSQHEPSFGCHIIFFVATTYFFVAHIILLANVNFYVKYFFCWHTSFLWNTRFFVLPNVSIKNMVD